ncbi:MAG: PD40 domain-containing protein [Bacteroidetes bacterium]|nr:PD40 domain-containing protein [Bacteroidota bacterium]
MKKLFTPTSDGVRYSSESSDLKGEKKVRPCHEGEHTITPFSIGINLFRASALLLLFFLPLGKELHAQPISKGEFRQMFTQGNLMMLDNFYDTACGTFLALNKADPSNANVNYKIGVCYLHLPGQKAKAIPYFENAIKQTSGNYLEDDPSEKNAPEDAAYYLGQAFHYAYRFDESMEQFKKFRDIIGKWNLNLVKEIDRWTEMSKNAKELAAHPVECTITNLGDSVNCLFADYSPAITADEAFLVFTSRRQGAGGMDNKTINDDFFEDIWICTQGKYGTWSKAKSISRAINTDGNEAAIGISADGQQLYVYRDDNGDGNIYVSKLDGDFWNTPYKLDASNINSKSWEPSACISADGNTMYFVSNRPGGLGGRDIYQCHRQPNRSWSEPENLGPSINTPYDEDAPFIHPDGVTFFFSSTGHNSMGGFDVFYSTKVSNTVWTNPLNMGYPINTTDDDIYFVTSSDGRRAYYASFRPEGKGEKDIYMVSMPKPFVKSVAILVGYLKNKDGSPIPKNALVTEKSSNGEIITSKPNEASGKFILSQLPGREYEITIEANAQKIFMDKFFLPEDSSYQNLSRGFFQRTIFIGDTSHLFSINKVTDTAAKIQMVPLDGKILFSQNSSDVAAHISVEILNSQGNILASAVTDSKGKFKFENISSGQNYILKINESDTVLKSHNQFYLADKNDKIIMPSTQEGRFFLFKRVSPTTNQVSAISAKDSTPLLATMSGKLVNKDMKKISNVKMNLVDATGKILQTKTSDKLGQFTFENIPIDNNYSISIDENDPSLLNGQKLCLLNLKNQLIKIVSKNGKYFIFENLPANLEKMSVLDATDTTTPVAMKGKLLSGTNPDLNGLHNIEVTLLNQKGVVIQRTKTDASGFFRFEHLSANENYSIKLNENDLSLSAFKRILLANEKGKIVKEISIGKNATFNNLPPDLMQLVELKDSHLPSSRDSITAILHKEAMYPEDKNFDFVVYFSYNKKEIDISVGSFLSLMEKVAATINEKGSATIMIVASSSNVPTKSYTGNEELAKARADEIKDRVHASMSLKNLDSGKITYEVSTKVQGPEYKEDAIQNKKEYEKWQFVKVIVK